MDYMGRVTGGTYTAEGIIKLCDALEVNETLKELKYAAPSPS